VVGIGGTVTLVGEIRLRTGTRVGTSEEEIEIGGLDNPVIKDPVTGYPYVPGSSMKGRCRALFELAWMKSRNIEPDVFFGAHHNERHECGFVRREVYEEAKEYLREDPPWLENGTCPVCRIFGSAGDEIRFSNPGRLKNERRGLGYDPYVRYRDPDDSQELSKVVNVKKEARVAFRDAHPTTYTVNEIFERAGEPTEVKHENAINRVSGEANPRSMERVPKGSRFGLEVVYRVEDEGELESDLGYLLSSMKLVEDQGIGHSTSRGYGRVEFRIAAVCARSTGWYLNPGTGEGFPEEEDRDEAADEVTYLSDLEAERYETVIRARDLEDRVYLRPEEWVERLDDVLGKLPWGR